MRSRIAIWALLAVLLLAVTATAGVVEDAAEALKNVPSDNPAGSRRFEGAGSPPYPTGAGSWSSSTRSGGAGTPPSTRAAGRKATSGSGSASALGGGAVDGPVAPEPADEAPSEQRKARDRADSLTTMFSLLMILLLVAAAGFYSKRLGRDD